MILQATLAARLREPHAAGYTREQRVIYERPLTFYRLLRSAAR